jgi:HSP20 family protein
MRSRIEAVVLPAEPVEFRDEVRRMFRELDRHEEAEPLTGECVPPLDVYENDHTIEISVDLPGVAADAVRVVAKGGTILIAGHKRARRTRGDSNFHLVERGYGRFIRAVRLSSPCDTSHASASMNDGELRITIPRLGERRGRAIPIAIASSAPQA